MGALLLLILINLWKNHHNVPVMPNSVLCEYRPDKFSKCFTVEKKKTHCLRKSMRRDSSWRTGQIRLEIVSGLLAAVVLNLEVVFPR